MNNKIKSRSIKTSKSKLPKYASGWYGAAGITKSGTAAASTMGGIGNIVGAASGLLKTEDEGSFGNYAGNILGDAGQFASMGAALGPWGAAGGAVVGAGIGLAKSISADKAQNAAERQEDINTNLGNVNAMSNAVNTKYNMRNFKNDRVSGFAKGTAKFKSGIANSSSPNAMIAPEEVTMDGYTGQLKNVPGKYNSSNPDTKSAVLTDGTSVYSNKDSQIIPGSDKTPAKMMKKVIPFQRRADKILNPKTGDAVLGSIDRRTAEINSKNISNLSENLNKYNMLLNPQQQQPGQLPKFEKGVVAFTKDGIDYYETEATDRMKKGNPYYTLDKNQGRKYIDTNRATYLKSKIQDNQKGQTAPNLGGADYTQYSADMRKRGIDPVSEIDFKKGRATQGVVRVPVAKQDSVPASQAANNPTVAAAPDSGVSKIPHTGSNPGKTKTRYDALAEQIITPGIKKPVGIVPGAATTTDTQNSPAVPVISNPAVNSLKMDKFKPGADMTDIGYPTSVSPIGRASFNDADIETAKSLGDAKYANTPTTVTPQNNTYDLGDESLGSKLSSIGNKLASVGPMIYNAFNNKPEVTRPIYNSYTNPNQRYNVAPELADATKQRQIARYNNASQNNSTGANMAYGADLYSRGVEQTSNLLGKAQTANAGYREAYANRANQFGAMNTAEDRRIQDVNMRNRAASRNFNAKNAEAFSQYGQMQELMGNQKKADVLNSNIWSGFATAMRPEDKAEFMRLVKQYTI